MEHKIGLFKPIKDQPNWAKKSTQELLESRLKDIYIPIEKTGLQPYLERLQLELEMKGFEHFKPYFWFSDEWFTPDNHTGIAIPFYLANRKLARIQESFIYDVEGGTPASFMRLLRHECGHAIDNAYKLRRRKKRQQIFGKSSSKYEDTYVPKPFSKKYVIHLDAFYSQSHPDEDFAETFAVWLDPRSRWRKKYKKWQGAYKKLQYMDELMHEIAEQKPLIKTRKKIELQSSLTKKLKDYYAEKRIYYGLHFPETFDVHLYKMFTNNPEIAQNMKASTFIRKIKKDVRKSVSPWTGTYQYTINQIIQQIIERCEYLDLKLRFPFEQSKYQFISMLSVVTIEYIHKGAHKVVR